MLLSTRLGFRLDSLHPDSRYRVLLKNNNDKQDSFVTRIVLPIFQGVARGAFGPYSHMEPRLVGLL